MTHATTNETFLQQFIGTWTFELSDDGGGLTTGREVVRALGDAFIVMENSGTHPDGTTSQATTILGWEPAKSRFTGAVAATMVAALWVYDGALSTDGATLVLDTEGPAMSGEPTTDRYRDIMHVIDQDNRELTAQVLDGNGQWNEFMRTTYRRVG